MTITPPPHQSRSGPETHADPDVEASAAEITAGTGAVEITAEGAAEAIAAPPPLMPATAMPATGRIESYRGPSHVVDQVPLPDAAACERALDRVGRGGECSLDVERGGPWVLMVGGGPERFQVCLWDTEADRGFEAVDPGAEPGVTVDLVTGGQGVVLLVSETVDRTAALAALVAFVERGERAESVAWVANG